MYVTCLCIIRPPFPCGVLCPGVVMQVNIGLRVLTRPNPEKLPQLYRTLGQVGVQPGPGGEGLTATAREKGGCSMAG